MLTAVHSQTVPEVRLMASDGALDDAFGTAVALDTDIAIIGAPFHDLGNPGHGAAYLYEFDGIQWPEVQKLNPAPGLDDEFFGISVSISGDAAPIGANWDDDNGTNSGLAYIFERSGVVWSESAKLTASDGAVGHSFGESVSLFGSLAFVGAHADGVNGSNSGSAYLFKEEGGQWVEVMKVVPEVVLAVYDMAGRKVAVLVDEYQSEGVKAVRWDGRESGGPPAASGVYLYQLRAGATTLVRKMVLIR